MAFRTNTIGYALSVIGGAKQSYYIPAMQRDYVWKEASVIELFNSIFHGFPIGSALVWDTEHHNPHNHGALNAYSFPIWCSDGMPRQQAHLDPGQKITFVLDGQQRLTSLNIAIRGGWRYRSGIDKKLFFNPRASEGRFFEILDIDKDNTNEYIPCADIMQWHSEESFQQYLNHVLMVPNDPKLETKERNLRQLRNRFWVDQAFSCGVYTANEMNDALEIFVLANNTGKPLDKSDLVIATLTTSWRQISANEEFDKLARQLNCEIESKRPFTKKNLIKSFLALAPVNLPISHSIKRITPEVISALEDFWPRFGEVMVKTVKLVKRWKLHRDKALTSVNALIPISCWILKNNINIDMENKEVINELNDAKTWLYAALFSFSFGGQSDQAISDAREVVLGHSESGFPLRKLNEAMDAHHSYDLLSKHGVNNFLDSLSYDSQGNRAAIQLALKLIRGRLKDANYQLDHIYPQSNKHYIGELGLTRIHKIENLELLVASENKIKSNQTPAMLWNNSEFDEGWRLDNQLPEGLDVINNCAIYDDPVRLMDLRKKDILNELTNKLGIDTLHV